MKILYITLENVSLHKGSVVHIKEIVDGLRRVGHKVGLIASSWGNFEEADFFYNLHRSLRVQRQPYVISSVVLFIHLLKVLPKYDVIYARDFHTVIIALIPRIMFKKKLVFEINGLASEEQKLKISSYFNWILSSLIRRAERMATKYSDRIVSVTPQIASYLMHQFHCPGDKVEVISNGVNTKIFCPIPAEDLLLHWKQKLGIIQEERVIAFIGNLAPWQGVEYLIQVAPLLIQRMKNIKFMVIGDGILKKKFEDEVKRLGLTHYFLFTGVVHYQDIPHYINFADICVALKKRLKSGYSPIKLYEYMACGKPVVASRVEGLEFLEEEGAGLLVEPEDIVSLEKALFKLLTNPQKRLEMGEKGLQLARDKFTWDSGVLRIEKILESLA